MKMLLAILSLLCSGIVLSQIRVESSTNDLGDIFEDKGIVITEFKLQNPYFRDTIRILDITTSCGCTAILSEDTIIYPRQSINLKVTYDPINRIGLFAKSIHIKTQTGQVEKNSLYLKIVGNVIGELKIDKSNPINLIEYRVAPIYFFPVTAYDTSYFEMSKIEEFVNDITFEIDYYSFTTLGFEIRLRDRSLVETFETLASFFKYKLIHEAKERGYSSSNVTFNNPVIIYDQNIPAWSVAKIKLYSLKFNDDKLKASVIKMTNDEVEYLKPYILNYNSDNMPPADSLLAQLDQKVLESKLFKNGKLDLMASVFVPESKGDKLAKKIAKDFNKKLFKTLKSSTGITQKEYQINFDVISTHAATKYKVMLWDTLDFQVESTIKYVEKIEEIIPPLLPTYKTEFFTAKNNIDINSIQFKQFWSALMGYASTGKNIEMIVESSASKYPKKPYTDPLVAAQEKGKSVIDFIKTKYKTETGKDLDVRLVTVVQGPDFETQNFTQPDYFKYEYIKLVPSFLTDRGMDLEPIEAKPYIVNYDYYYIGVDIESMVFKRFCDYLIYEIQTRGYVEIRTESSASNLIVDSRKSNEYWAYSHLNVSKTRLLNYLKSKLIDPNRLIISNEKIVVQGIPYNTKTPIVRYKKFQYVTFIPVKYL